MRARGHASTLYPRGRAFWPNARDANDPEPEWLARQFAQAPKSDAFVYMKARSLESTIALETTLLASNRHPRDVLQTGYRVKYVEIPGGHQPVHWRRGLADGLMAVLGGEGAGLPLITAQSWARGAIYKWD
jgi:enterochelin esterase-like enzyme